ncbi:hypothetical protein EIP86_008917 [Pleurotus ostreatoroseus]|nr:hypothetical protein EIP86_008917 [Pleurotus ostreatoroseus]
MMKTSATRIITDVRTPDTDSQRADTHGATNATEASTTSPTTDELEDIPSTRTIASIMPTECASDRDNCAQGIDNGNTTHHPMHTFMNADESNVTSPTIEGAEHANEPSQDSVAVIRDEIYNREAVSDGAATDPEDRDDEDDSTTPRNPSLASSSARCDDDDDGDAFLPVGAWASTDPSIPEDSPTNRQTLRELVAVIASDGLTFWPCSAVMSSAGDSDGVDEARVCGQEAFLLRQRKENSTPLQVSVPISNLPTKVLKMRSRNTMHESDNSKQDIWEHESAMDHHCDFPLSTPGTTLSMIAIANACPHTLVDVAYAFEVRADDELFVGRLVEIGRMMQLHVDGGWYAPDVGEAL